MWVNRAAVKLPNIFEKKTELRSFKAGETIFAVGDPPEHMYVVKTGEVDIDRDGRIVETIGPDGFFGEMALVDSHPRSATARAKTDCELAPINEKQFLFMVSETPFFAIIVMRALVTRLRRP
jgi:CRP-like cAMP-binding protein